MKIPALILAGSLAANAVLVALFLARPPSVAPEAGSGVALAEKSAPRSTVPTTEAVPLATVLAELRAGDLTGFVARLRAAGFSPALIRAFVTAAVNEQFGAQRAAILSEQNIPYWRNPFDDPKTKDALRDLNKQQAALIRSILGPQTELSEEAAANRRRYFGPISAEKLTQLQKINSDYNELQQEIYAKTNGVMLPEDREKLAYLEKEKLADIAKALTPQEYEDFLLRSSGTANEVRNRLGQFTPTETEFRAIYQLQAAFDAKYALRDGSPTAEATAARFEAHQKLQSAILDSLSPDRAAAYKLANNSDYQQASRLVARLELPPATTQQVVSLQQDFQNRQRALMTNRELTPADRTAQQATLLQEATAKLSATLTPRGLEAYKQNGGYWLESLKPRPAAPSGMTTPSIPPGAQPAMRLPGGE